ncbi:MarR family winged helix-turn-helix transcriptional regulator [Rhodopseudomonas sp. HC1]|uniref:MarR family winged helix-turn-helix transcriptional regulator n=1 Tax=Rhodopseudomonas infernalis TaxID=2897386 RepID=UPI001EE888B4|nr:MarR family winged helix-turn-helix transcriptional regulator [Rhodopseudomonas infernalis]MCG6204526.1 MarR family winged helix-turn-helix transcriptional regulator [Rhodopseudomonas infernalis]
MADKAKTKAQNLFRRPGFLVRRLHQIYVAIYLKECEQFGTTPVQTSIMQVLLGKPGLDQVALAAEIGMDRTTTSNVLTRLEKRGIIRREEAEKDRRVRLAFLTQEGSAMLADMQTALDRAHSRLIAPLPEKERDTFIRHLALLVESNNGVGRTVLRNL